MSIGKSYPESICLELFLSCLCLVLNVLASGLLLDTENIYSMAIQEVSDRYGGKALTWDLKVRQMGLVSADLSALVVKELELPITPDQYLAEVEPINVRLFPKANLMPGTCMTRSSPSQAVRVWGMRFHSVSFFEFPFLISLRFLKIHRHHYSHLFTYLFQNQCLNRVLFLFHIIFIKHISACVYRMHRGMCLFYLQLLTAVYDKNRCGAAVTPLAFERRAHSASYEQQPREFRIENDASRRCFWALPSHRDGQLGSGGEARKTGTWYFPDMRISLPRTHTAASERITFITHHWSIAQPVFHSCHFVLSLSNIFIDV